MQSTEDKVSERLSNGGHKVGSYWWLMYQASQIAYLYERVSNGEATERLFNVIAEYNSALKESAQ